MPLLSLSEARDLITETLERCGTSRSNAESVSSGLIAAECFGKRAHGISRLPSYALQSLSGKVDGTAEPHLERLTPSSLRIDASHGFSYPALDLAIEHLPSMAKEQGVAVAIIRRAHHCGVAGVWVDRLAQQGLVSLFFTNTPAAMPPIGGTKAVFGTNPIAFGLPRSDSPPMIIDLSLSKIARGRVMSAARKGEKLEEGIALDSTGAPTTDPQAALSGMMLPMGDIKGTMLALMVELLTGGLSGSNYAMESSSFFSPDGVAPSLGHLLIALDPQILGGDTILSRFEVLLDSLTSQSGVRLPGSNRFSIESSLAQRGIDIDNELFTEISNL